MGDYKSCSTCANCDKSRNPWRCKLGKSTRGGRWTAQCGEWRTRETKSKRRNGNG